MRDRIDEERLATCGESAIDLAITKKYKSKRTSFIM